MGEVYRANDLLLGQTVALKFLPAQWTSDETTLVRFRLPPGAFFLPRLIPRHCPVQ
jgi:hypothetical protein